jgi:hypothetical protein
MSSDCSSRGEVLSIGQHFPAINDNLHEVTGCHFRHGKQRRVNRVGNKVKNGWLNNKTVWHEITGWVFLLGFFNLLCAYNIACQHKADSLSLYFYLKELIPEYLFQLIADAAKSGYVNQVERPEVH